MSDLQNPLRSEAAMFRLVVIVGIAAIPVIALGALAGPTWGAVVLAVEVLAGMWLLCRRARAAGDEQAP
jgi:hypothetical protein